MVNFSTLYQFRLLHLNSNESNDLDFIYYLNFILWTSSYLNKILTGILLTLDTTINYLQQGQLSCNEVLT